MVTREVQQATTMTRPRRAHVPPGRSRGFLINTSWTWTKGWALTVETVTSGAMGTASNMSSWRAVWLGESLRGGSYDDMTCLQIFCSVLHTSPASVQASPGAVSPTMSCGTYELQNFLTIYAETRRASWASSSGDFKIIQYTPSLATYFMQQSLDHRHTTLWTIFYKFVKESFALTCRHDLVLWTQV